VGRLKNLGWSSRCDAPSSEIPLVRHRAAIQLPQSDGLLLSVREHKANILQEQVVPVVSCRSGSVKSPQCVLFRYLSRSRCHDSCTGRAVDIRLGPHSTRPAPIGAVTVAELVESVGVGSSVITSAVGRSPKTTLKAVFETLTQSARLRKRTRLTRRFAPTVALPRSTPGMRRIRAPMELVASALSVALPTSGGRPSHVPGSRVQ
jgi:hypothetical protein